MSRTHSESIGLAPGPDSPPTIHPIDGSKVELAKRPKKRFEGQEFHVGIGPAQMVNAHGVILVLDAHAHFARDFLADRFRRSFSSGESTSGSDWRSWQNLRVDLDQFLMQVLQFPEFSDFSLGLSRCGLVGQQFSSRLAVDLEGQAEIGTVAWILGLMAMAVRFATSARGGSDRSTTQIAESGDLIGHVDALLFQEIQGLWGCHRGRAAEELKIPFVASGGMADARS